MVNAETKKTEGKIAVSSKDLGITLKAPNKGVQTSFALWIRSLLQNWRQGTVACKGRADVSRSGKKPWKQKGTGRARAGTARSPLWRGGGVTFGPQPRTRELKVTRAAKKQVYEKLLYDFLSGGKVISLDWSVEGDKPQTAVAHKALKQVGLTDKKVVIFLPMEDLLAYTSVRNLPKVRVLFFDQPNAFDLANADYWVFFKKDLDHFKEMVLRWI